MCASLYLESRSIDGRRVGRPRTSLTRRPPTRQEREDRARREHERKEARREAKLAEMAELMEASDGEDEDAWWEEDDLYCPVCDRHFRSKGAFGDHERGKKHLDGVMRLLEEEGLDVEQLGHHRRARDLRPHRIARCDHTRQLVHGRTWLGLGLG